MGKIILFILGIATMVVACNTSKNQEPISLSSILPMSVNKYSGSFEGEVLDANNRKTNSTIVLSEEDNSYYFYCNNIEHTGTFSRVNKAGNIIELNGLGKYPNRFMVTQEAIIQLMDGNILQDVEGNNKFVLAKQS